MAMDLLMQIADSRLPATFHRNEDIDRVRVLQAAGLVVALVPSPLGSLASSGSRPAAQVLAITEKGREELSKLGYRGSRPPLWRLRMPRIKTATLGRRMGASSASREPPRLQ